MSNKMQANKHKDDLPYWLEIAIGATVWCIFIALCSYVVLGFFLTPY